MDVVRAEVQAVGGRIETRSQAGRGTCFKLVLPLTTAVTKVVMVDATFKAVRAFVPDFQLSLAIGNGGQNARLAAKLTGAKIDIQPDSALEQ